MLICVSTKNHNYSAFLIFYYNFSEKLEVNNSVSFAKSAPASTIPPVTRSGSQTRLNVPRSTVPAAVSITEYFFTSSRKNPIFHLEMTFKEQLHECSKLYAAASELIGRFHNVKSNDDLEKINLAAVKKLGELRSSVSILKDLQ